MSMIEILNELPRLKPDERNFLFLKLHDLDASIVEETTQVTVTHVTPAIAQDDSDLSSEEIREHIRQVDAFGVS